MHQQKNHRRQCKVNNKYLLVSILIFFSLFSGESWAPPVEKLRLNSRIEELRRNPQMKGIRQAIRHADELKQNQKKVEKLRLNSRTEELRKNQKTFTEIVKQNRDKISSPKENISHDDIKRAEENLGKRLTETTAVFVPISESTDLGKDGDTVIFYEVSPKNIAGAPHYYNITKNGAFISSGDDIHLLLEQLKVTNHGNKKIYIDISKFEGDKKNGIKYSLEFYNIANESKFGVIENPIHKKLLLSPLKSIETSDKNIINVTDRYAEKTVDIINQTNEKYKLRIRTEINSPLQQDKIDNPLQQQVMIDLKSIITKIRLEESLNWFLEYIKGFITIPLADIPTKAKFEFSKRYPGIDIRMEVIHAAGNVVLADYNDIENYADSFAYLPYPKYSYY